MDINQTRKVINSMLQDKITAEDCRKALNELDSLKQAESDLTKVVAKLEKERDNLTSKLSEADAKALATQTAADLYAEGKKAEGDKLVDAAKNEAAKLLESAGVKLRQVEAAISNAEERARKAELDAVEAEKLTAEKVKAHDDVMKRLKKAMGE